MQVYFAKQSSVAPLAVFRLAFGLMVFAGILRFWLKGWIDTLYIQPKYYFSYYGFEFIQALGENSYLIFFVCGLAALMVAIGAYYRIASVCLFLSFTYIELIDKTNYLNHYYFVTAISFLLIFLPAHAYFSLDAWRSKAKGRVLVPSWCIDVLKVFVSLLYVCAGIAKLNSDWLIHAQPLAIWLPAHNDLPILGSLFNYKAIAYLFSWLGCLYDLSIPFLLWRRRTRPYAYSMVVIFHVLTAILFPIGMFPYIMIVTALIFFSAEFHEKLISRIRAPFLKPASADHIESYTFSPLMKRVVFSVFLLFFSVQLLLPFRYLLYPGELFWTEEGYRFSWRVMLMEKLGSAQFTVKDKSGKFSYVNNAEFLTPLQEKMMATQPDMILQYAHILRDHYKAQGFTDPQVYVESYVTLNGRLSKRFIDQNTDLSLERESLRHKTWIAPFNDEIRGF